MAAQSDGNIIIIMGIWSLGPLRHGPFDIEAAVVSIFVLVFPGNDVRLDNIREPIAGDDIFSFMPNIHFLSLDIERFLQLLLDICNFFYGCVCFSAFKPD